MPLSHNGSAPALRAGPLRASRFDSWRGRFDSLNRRRRVNNHLIVCFEQKVYKLNNLLLFMRKRLKIIIIFLILFIAIISIFIIKNYTSRIRYLEDFEESSYSLPIKTERGAINFFLQNDDVKNELINEGRWWVKANRFDPKNYDGIWIVALGNGSGECFSPYQCYMRFSNNGTIEIPLSCSEGWNCK